jgi:hypothetical protein
LAKTVTYIFIVIYLITYSFGGRDDRELRQLGTAAVVVGAGIGPASSLETTIGTNGLEPAAFLEILIIAIVKFHNCFHNKSRDTVTPCENRASSQRQNLDSFESELFGRPNFGL